MADHTWLAELFAATDPPPKGFEAKDALSTLLGVESFLFGTLNVALAAALPTQMGIRVLKSPRGFAIIVAGLVTLMGAGACLAWFDLFLGDGWPSGCLARATAVVILAAVLAQPLLTLFIAIGVKNDTAPGVEAPPVSGL